MHRKSLILILIALLIQLACARVENIYNGGHNKLFRAQQRSINGEARFTTDILKKLALKGKLTTTTADPTITTISLEPTLTSGTGPAGTTTTGTLTYPGTITSGTRPAVTTSDTSAADSTYSPTSSSPGPGDDAVTSLPQQPPNNGGPVDELPNNSEAAITSRLAIEDDDDDDKATAFDKLNGDEIPNIILYEYNDKLSAKNKAEYERMRQTRNQMRRPANQQANKKSQRRRKTAMRQALNRRQTAANLRNRRKSTHRRKLVRRRINARRQAQINAILKRRRPNNRYPINSKPLKGYPRRPLQRIIIRQL